MKKDNMVATYASVQNLGNHLGYASFLISYDSFNFDTENDLKSSVNSTLIFF